MSPHVHLCLVLHNHQPIGNFDGVFEQAYQDSYLPFLEVFEPYDALNISLHTSGPLMLWLAERHPEYLDRVRLLVEAGRIEIVGGPQYEPILWDKFNHTVRGCSETWVSRPLACGCLNASGNQA